MGTNLVYHMYGEGGSLTNSNLTNDLAVREGTKRVRTKLLFPFPWKEILKFMYFKKGQYYVNKGNKH